MKTTRFLVAVLLLGSVAAFATNARVESMGKNTTFIMDDISIFDNPANINLYPNFLIGELGNYASVPSDSLPKAGANHDPWDPWFGGIFSLKISADNSLAIAGVLNRKDERLFKYFPDYIIYKDTNGKPVYVSAPVPVTNFDGFLGANFNNKAFGLHIYIAHQDGLSANNEISKEAFVSALQVDGGTNIEISSDYSIEASGGFARIQFGSTDHGFFDTDLFSAFARARLFSKVETINGHLIPAASVYNMNAPGIEDFTVNGGIGADAAFDRGFFWIGLNAFYNSQRAGDNWTRYKTGTAYEDKEGYTTPAGDITKLWQLGGTISFGIERNIWWDWFVLRVGGQKTIAYADYNAAKRTKDGVNSALCPTTQGCPESGNYFVSNPINDGTTGDNVGFGIGINIEEKLKIDATVAEDVVFRNPFQGEGRLISRISASYSF
ncbi:hypothetical protein AGMMS49938_08550 [Fibrobacterales bacterium]|nr:hypothetical protein AGMMS49938_08550 [Fibrobacterales bacterium]